VKLAIFGATGTVGSAVLAQALAIGHEVRLLARRPSKVPMTDGRQSVLQGNANDPQAVRRTITGCDAVLTALGGFSDTDSIRVGTGNIIAAMHDSGIRRLVVMQGFHLEFPGDPENFGRKAILPLLVMGSRSLLPDSRAMASAIQASDLDWTVVRAPRVVVGDRTGNYRTGRLELGPWNSVTNGDVADLMLACLDEPATIRAAPMVARGARRATRRVPLEGMAQ